MPQAHVSLLAFACKEEAESSSASENSAQSLCLLHATSDELTSLTCDELLAELGQGQEAEGRPFGLQHAGQQVQQGHSPCDQQRLSSPACASSPQLFPEAALLASNEHTRQQEICPCPCYLQRHGINEMHRAVAISWLFEVMQECSMRSTTLFLAVSYLDRFFSVAQDVTPGMLQLVATAALSIAAKNEEVAQPTCDEWVSITDNSFTAKDLVQMEYLVLHYLDWRIRTPTAHTFLQLLCSSMDVGADEAKVATYFTELALLDYGMLKYKYSTVAAAALLAAHQRRGAAFDVPLLLSIAPYVADESAQACAAALLALHEQCWSDVLLPGMEHFEVLRKRHELSV